MKIKLWTKNPVHSGINFEYIAEFEVKNSYPDFIVVKNDHYIYLEVKKYEEDINKEKTKILIEEYKKYTKK
ncbi:hypothetical protein AB5V95_02980 [Metamycoplasma spumans]|uniref:hypothetical protein n=1 Tax=Metamycoplasma spumans TaxID=92406 RepID=UPI0034DD100C